MSPDTQPRDKGPHSQALSDSRPILRQRTRHLALIWGVAIVTIGEVTVMLTLPYESPLFYPLVLGLFAINMAFFWIWRRGPRAPHKNGGRVSLDSPRDYYHYRALSDPRPILRQRTRRLAVTGITVGTVSVGASLVVLPYETVGYPAVLWLIALGVVPAWLARRGTRRLEQAPEHLLDERQIREVHSAYRQVYVITMTMVGITLAAAVLSSIHLRLEAPLIHAAFTLFFVILQLPTLVLAWRLDDEEPEEALEDAATAATAHPGAA